MGIIEEMQQKFNEGEFNLQYAELPKGETFTGTIKELRAGDWLKASVYGYSLVESVNGSTIHFAGGGSESGYPYARPIHRPLVNETSSGIVSVSYPADDAVKIYKVDCKLCGAVADYDYEQDAWDRAHTHNISHGSGTIITIDKA